MCASNGMCKVGAANNPCARAVLLWKEYGYPVRIMHVTPILAEAHLIEVTAHRLLLKHEVEAEWFAVDPVTAKRAVRRAVRLSYLKPDKLPRTTVCTCSDAATVKKVAAMTRSYLRKFAQGYRPPYPGQLRPKTQYRPPVPARHAARTSR